LVGGDWINAFFPNLLLRNEEIDDSIWTKASTSSVIANQAVAPDGTNTADEITLSSDPISRVFQTALSQPAGDYTFSVFLRARTGESGLYPLRISAFGAGGTTTDLLVSIDDTKWTRFDLTATQTGVGDVVVYPGNRQAAGENLLIAYVWGSQVVNGSSALDYNKVVDIVGRKLEVA